MKETIVNRLLKLFSVKSIVTLVLTVVFAFLCIYRDAIPESFMMIYTVVISFYFGTQAKKDTAATETAATANVAISDTIEERVRALEVKSETWDSVVAIVNEEAEANV